MRNILLFVLGTMMASNVYAQEDESSNKSFNHYFGLQVNGLYREILSFNDNNVTINNPYFITYSSNNKNTNKGISLGLGYKVDHFSDGDDDFERETKRSDFNIRIGSEKKSMIGKKIMLGVAFDLLLNRSNNETISTSSRSTVTSKVNTKAFGIGPRININYIISEKLLIGTEANYYYRYSLIDQSLSEKSAGGSIFNESDTEATAKSFDLELPLVLYMTIKF